MPRVRPRKSLPNLSSSSSFSPTRPADPLAADRPPFSPRLPTPEPSPDSPYHTFSSFSSSSLSPRALSLFQLLRVFSSSRSSFFSYSSFRSLGETYPLASPTPCTHSHLPFARIHAPLTHISICPSLSLSLPLVRMHSLSLSLSCTHAAFRFFCFICSACLFVGTALHIYRHSSRGRVFTSHLEATYLSPIGASSPFSSDFLLSFVRVALLFVLVPSFCFFEHRQVKYRITIVCQFSSAPPRRVVSSPASVASVRSFSRRPRRTLAEKVCRASTNRRRLGGLEIDWGTPAHSRLIRFHLDATELALRDESLARDGVSGWLKISMKLDVFDRLDPYPTKRPVRRRTAHTRR